MRTNDGLCEAVWIVSRRVGRLGDRDERLERHVQHLLRAERVLEHVIGLPESRAAASPRRR